MKKTPLIGIALFVLAVMEGVSWMAFQSPSEPFPLAPTEGNNQPVVLAPEPQAMSSPEETQLDIASEPKTSTPPPPTGVNGDTESFPLSTLEVVRGRAERTIHMGVRQYAWEPATITAQQRELVRLIIHNADVLHGLVIPDLGVNQDILPDGAVVEFHRE